MGIPMGTGTGGTFGTNVPTVPPVPVLIGTSLLYGKTSLQYYEEKVQAKNNEDK